MSQSEIIDILVFYLHHTDAVFVVGETELRNVLGFALADIDWSLSISDSDAYAIDKLRAYLLRLRGVFNRNARNECGNVGE